jgi:hypothetical protein
MTRLYRAVGTRLPGIERLGHIDTLGSVDVPRAAELSFEQLGRAPEQDQSPPVILQGMWQARGRSAQQLCV